MPSQYQFSLVTFKMNFKFKINNGIVNVFPSYEWLIQRRLTLSKTIAIIKFNWTFQCLVGPAAMSSNLMGILLNFPSYTYKYYSTRKAVIDILF